MHMCVLVYEDQKMTLIARSLEPGAWQFTKLASEARDPLSASQCEDYMGMHHVWLFMDHAEDWTQVFFDQTIDPAPNKICFTSDPINSQ